MDNQTPESARIDLPITVESAEPHAPAAASHAARGRCTHRPQWSDLSFLSKYRVIRHLIAAAAALAVAAGCLTEGIQTMRSGLDGADDLRTALGVIAMLTAIPLAAGPIEYLRTLRSPHRPSHRVLRLHNTALFALFCFACADLADNEWLILTTIPAFALMQELRFLRFRLTDRATCATDPEGALMLRLMRKRADLDARTDEEREHHYGPRITIDGFDSWTCPHTITWAQLRTRAKIEALASNGIQHLYLLGALLVVTAVVANTERFPLPGLEGVEFTVAIGVAMGLAWMNQIAYRSAGGGPHLHRMPLSAAAWAIAAYASTGALAAATAAVLDRPYLWAVVPLALYMIYGNIDHFADCTPASTCKSRPGFTRSIQADLKA
ncbi:hypothetical protein [Glycomyces sp. MUSA5-2]|uniref:hypothetical protein n=1 Tax=Glycomyces sp. MUSA5-2 TaxID=2053002 RepID=UPI00300A2BCF